MKTVVELRSGAIDHWPDSSCDVSPEGHLHIIGAMKADSVGRPILHSYPHGEWKEAIISA